MGDDGSNFALVLPSNCQPEIFPQNTAAAFSTFFENPKTLDGPWEVAMKDLSFVNTVQTFKNEKLSVDRVEETVSKQEFPLKEFEAVDRVVTYDLTQHSIEWKLATKASDNDIEKKMIRGVVIETILNRLMSKIFWWTHTDRMYLRCIDDSNKNYVYGIYLSEHLRRILNIYRPLILPEEKFPEKDARPTVRKYTLEGPSYVMGDDMSKGADYDEKQPLHLTVLPFHRMQKTTFSTTANIDIHSFINEVNAEMRKYGLIAAANVLNQSAREKRSAKKEDDQKKTKKKKKKEGKEKTAVKITLQYNGSIETDDIALILMPLNVFDKRSTLYMYFFINTYVEFDVEVDKIPSCTFTIYSRKTIPPKITRIRRWICDIPLPTRNYKTEQQLLTVLNNRSNPDNAHLNYVFSYNELHHRFQLTVKDDLIVRMSNTLQNILGFTQSEFPEGTYTASKLPVINRNIHHIYLYTNIISPIYVGGRQVQLLRYVPIPNSDYGETVYKEFLTPLYLPLAVNQLQQVDMALYDDAGELIPFEEGRTVITLHFRKRNYV